MWTRQKTLLSLLEWSDVIGINPYLLAQIGEPAAQLSNALGDCENVFYQTASSGSGHLSREDIAYAINQAEFEIANWLRTWPAPKAESYPVQYARPANLRWRQLWTGTSGRLKTVQAKFGNIISMGVYVETLLDDNVVIVTSDPYSDGFDTLWTATVAVPAGTVASELAVYFSAADIPAPLVRAEMEIRPVNVTISGLVATISGPMTQLVKVVNYLKLVGVSLDASDATIYAGIVDVYRRTVDLNQSGTLIWDNNWCPTPPCTYLSSNACFEATNAVAGYVAPVPANFDAESQAYERLYPYRFDAPDRVLMNLISGIPRDDNGYMARPLREAVAYLSVGLFLQNKSCGCAQADNILFALRSMPIMDNGTLEISQPLYDAVSAKFGLVNRGTVKAYTLLQPAENTRIYDSASW